MATVQHVFVIGSKGLGNYGGYETFVDKLTQMHQNNEKIKYHVACKLNGQGMMDETQLIGAEMINPLRFNYHNADCFKIHVPDKIGSAQAIYYDIQAFKWCVSYIKRHNINNSIIYVLACRIGPFFRGLVKKAHDQGAKVFVNPDGHEWMRAKWSVPVRKYWMLSERLMVKYSDLLICDSLNIEKYIRKSYYKYKPQTTYISYGADIEPSVLKDDDKDFVGWMKEKELNKGQYYLIVGRFVPENNFETMIFEFMKSNSKKQLAIITTKDEIFLAKLDEKLHFSDDKRIKFVGTVYNSELLKKIRENAFAYIHGHSVGGTNPSLLEALGATKINLLFNVGFNREVAESSALYWSKNEGDLAKLINEVDLMKEKDILLLSEKAKYRISSAYSWNSIADKYAEVFGVK